VQSVCEAVALMITAVSYLLLVLRNVGTSESMLTVSGLQTTGPGLCVGARVDGVCQPGALPAVAPFTSLTLPVVLEVTADTPHPWSIRFETNDPDHPVVEVRVRVSVERFAPCQWSGPLRARFFEGSYSFTKTSSFFSAFSFACSFRPSFPSSGARMANQVRAALIQCSNPINDESVPVKKIQQAMLDKHIPLIEEAAKKGTQILCLQEIFNGPYFCPGQDKRWYAAAEGIPGDDGAKIVRVWAALRRPSAPPPPTLKPSPPLLLTRARPPPPTPGL
jgi:hypothetical protein